MSVMSTKCNRTACPAASTHEVAAAVITELTVWSMLQAFPAHFSAAAGSHAPCDLWSHMLASKARRLD